MAYDAIVIGAGAAGEGAGTLGGELGGTIAVVERDLVGGLCGFWACMPSKSLLDSAARRAVGAEYPWARASERRDWMISREGLEYPDDGGHVARLRASGAELVRGEARIVGPGRVEVRSNGERPRTLEGRTLVLCVGSVPHVPPINGLHQAGFWTSNEGTALRELPSSILVMGGGPVGVELAQVYVRFGVSTTLVDGNDRLLARDHPRSSEALTRQLEGEGVRVRTGVRAERVEGGGEGRRVHLSDGSVEETAQVLVAVGRRPADLRTLGAEEAGVVLDERGGVRPDRRMAVGEAVYAAGDVTGGLMFTHTADYEGRVAIRAALGQEVRADHSAVPRTTFTDPETASVGRTVDQARADGVDAFEVWQDFAVTARGFTLEHVGGDLRTGAPGHVTAVVDEERGVLVGAFAACPGASELIHLAVLAIKQQTPVAVLADTIGAFPTAGRVFTNLMATAMGQLGSDRRSA